jgi:Tfp pilus tip-associated adhesin PilY1
MSSQSMRRFLARLLAFALAFTQVTQSVATTLNLATKPLAAETTAAVRPNLMYVLDDSGSMGWEYTPDYINDGTTAPDPNSPGGSYGDGAIATISGGAVTAIGPDGSPPAFSHQTYLSAPRVIIEGPNGSGAAATANMGAPNSAGLMKITSITVTNGGSGYTTTPHVSLVGGLSNATWGMCWGISGTVPLDTTRSPTCTSSKQIPWASSAVNYQFYDPTIRYEQPIKADGTRYPPATPTSAPSNGFTLPHPAGTNLTTSWPHEIWCDRSVPSPALSSGSATSSATNSTHAQCKENTDTSNNNLYPNSTYALSKTYNGPAAYYVASPAYYCSDAAKTNCIAATAPTVQGGTTFNVPAEYLWCSYYNPTTKSYGSCQGRRDANHYVPSYLGGWIPTTGTAAVQATADLTLSGVPANGQQINSVTVNGVDLVGGTVFTSVGGDQAAITEAICTAIEARKATTGFGCSYSSAGTPTARIISLVAGAASNGQRVLVAGPTGPAAANSSTSFRVLNATSGYQLASVYIDRGGVGDTELLNSGIVANGDVGLTAKDICEKINGKTGSNYQAKSGSSSDIALEWGSCTSDPTGWIAVKRLTADTTDNGLFLKTAGPTPVASTGTITVSATGGATRIDDILVAGASILHSSQKPMTYADGNQRDTIAADIASRINTSRTANATSTCVASATANVVTLTSCAVADPSTITVQAAATRAAGTLRVVSIGSGNAGDLGYIDVSTTRLVNHVTSANIASTTAVSTNASYLAGLIAGNAGWSATSAVNGSAYDIAVQAPAGNSFNDLQFTVGNGTPAGGSSGSAPQWTFRISNATADAKLINYITCGPNTTATYDTITRSVASTGAGATSDYIANLVTTGANKLNGRNWTNSFTGTNWSFACTLPTASTAQCDITGSGGSLCNQSNFDTPVTSAAGITMTTPSRTQTASSGSSPTWTFDITAASADNKNVTGISCGSGGSSALLGSSANTGTAASYASQLAARMQAEALGGAGDWSSVAQRCQATSSSALRCDLCRRQGSYRCGGNTIQINSTGVTVGAVTESFDNSSLPTGFDADGRWCYSFTLSGIDAGTDGITSAGIQCPSGDTSDVVDSRYAGTLPDATVTRINNLKTALASNINQNGYSASCTTATSGTPSSTCTVTGPTGAAACSTLSFTNDGSITVANQVRTSAGSGSTPSKWRFNISAATAANVTINELRCNGSRSFDESSGIRPSTGASSASTVYARINNLTQGSGLAGIGANGYTYSCSTATAGSAFSDCTVNGPVGAAACNVSDFNINTDASITVINKARTAAGSTAGTATIDYAPALSTQAALTGGYAVQTTATTTYTGSSPTAITTDAPALMSNGNPSSTLDIQTNATAPSFLSLSGGQDAVSSAAGNKWTGVGKFRRVDIVSGQTYNRTSGRTDCAGATCTYTEELQNFANWYSYYRSRMLMMKSATTLAFTQLDDKYNVGFDNICQATGLTVDRPVLPFFDRAADASAIPPVTAVTNRSQWWSNLTGATPNCATPLRTETAKIGKYFAGKLNISSTHRDPMEYSCQQNFMLLVTDGYWNENEPASTAINGDTSKPSSDIKNHDNVLGTAGRPVYDGAMPSATCLATGAARGGNYNSCRTLADIAYYYFSTDIRQDSFANSCVSLSTTPTASVARSLACSCNNKSSFPGPLCCPGTVVNGDGSCSNITYQDVSLNNVLTTSDDKSQAQHMNFYAMGLGIDGTLEYKSDYQTSGTGDYAEIRAGTRNWPAVANLDPTGVDDLWHGTANGRGKYFSARNLPAVVAGLREALNKIGARVGAAAAAATSNLEPVAGDNFAYVASYATLDWVGDLQSRSIDLTTGQVSEDTNCGQTGSGCQWSAQAKLDNQLWTTRRIYMAPTSASPGDPLRPFTYANLSGGEAAYFAPGPSGPLSQYSLYSTDPDMTGERITEFLRGSRQFEQDGNGGHSQLFRFRAHVMGDVVDTQPVFMKKPSFSYLDAGYVNFKTTGTAATRKPVVFVSAQDGMIHAFNADTANVTMNGTVVQPGEELWAFFPTDTLARLKTLADVNYVHQFFVDGLITVGDVDFGSAGAPDWRTILVAGQGGGGKSYIALDVTDPLSPKYLWEFTDARLGYSYGQPGIAKHPTLGWSVFISSGYNSADGRGFILVLNPANGTVRTAITNSSGDGANPSNLGKINGWAEEPLRNNTWQYIYAGDTNGDLWRFDLAPGASGHPVSADGTGVFKLAHLSDSSTGTPIAQPITTKPELTATEDGTRLVFVGTGKYLEPIDINAAAAHFGDVQSFYAIKDTLGAANLAGAEQETWNPKSDTKVIDGVSQNMFQQRKLIANKTVGGTEGDGGPITAVVNGQTLNYRQICSGAASIVTAGLTCGNETGGNVESGTSFAVLDTHTITESTASPNNKLRNIAVGDEITVSGFSNAANNGIFTVTAIASGSITVDATLTVEAAGATVRISNNRIDFSKYGGWYIDLPETGERMNVDMNLTLGTLTFASNIPAADSCTNAGRSWVNYVNYKTGLAVPKTDRKVSVALPTSLVVGLTIVKLPSGALSAIVTTSDYKQVNINPSFTPATFSARRSLWREYEAY